MNVRRRLLLIIILTIIVPLGFATKFYSGPGSYYVNNYLCGVFYVIFFILLVHAVIAGATPFRASISVLTLTCALEALQLWKPPLLVKIRSTFIGVALLGEKFDWFDFPHYFAGAVVGFYLVKTCRTFANCVR